MLRRAACSTAPPYFHLLFTYQSSRSKPPTRVAFFAAFRAAAFLDFTPAAPLLAVFLVGRGVFFPSVFIHVVAPVLRPPLLFFTMRRPLGSVRCFISTTRQTTQLKNAFRLPADCSHPYKRPLPRFCGPCSLLHNIAATIRHCRHMVCIKARPTRRQTLPPCRPPGLRNK